MENRQDRLEAKIVKLENVSKGVCDSLEKIKKDIEKINKKIEKLDGLVALEKYRNDGNATSK